ncbi:MAG: thiamine pyrophosphate-dependent enzyme [Burkholderiaceae bacterium]
MASQQKTTGTSDAADTTDAAIWGREAFLKLLLAEGVTHMFGNPGTTELPIMHALRDVPGMTYVLGLQESVVVAMADGYARASGELVSCNVHVAPGLGNAMGTLFTAWYSGTPMIVTAGQQEQGHGLTEPLLYGPLLRMAEPVVKWAVEVNRLEDLPRIMHRAAKIALTPPTGPVFISLPGDILNLKGPVDLSRASRVRTDTVPGSALRDEAVSRILAARNPVIMAGHEMVAANAFDEAVEFADLLGAPVYQQTVPSGAHFPSQHPQYMGDLSRNQLAVHDKLKPHDLLISLGADILRMSVYDPVHPLPRSTEVLHIGLNDWEMAKNDPAALAVRADLKETLSILNPAIREKGGSALGALAAQRRQELQKTNWNAIRAARIEAARDKRNAVPMNPDWLMQAIVSKLPDDAIVVEEALVTSRPLLTYLPYKNRHSFFGNCSGGIGWAIAAAVGISLAKPKRRVVAIIGDGSAMYSIQALWTAAHLKLPITYIIANNGGYRIIKERLRLFHENENYIAMDFEDPPISSSGLAEGFGMPSVVAGDAAQMESALEQSFASDGPMLIEAMVETGR